MRLKDKVAVITGGASGIGEATARTFAREGAKVLILDLNPEAGAAVKASIGADGGEIDFLQGDAAEPESLEKAVNQTLERYGRLDILHNNHVWFEAGRVGDLTLEGFRRSLDVSLTAYWYAIKLALVPMVSQGSGAIVNTSSVSGVAGDYGLGAYNVLKAGIINLTRVTGIEYARKGIRCNAVCPGPVATPPIMQLKEHLPDIYENIRQAIPMGRYGKPEEIANVVLFLASDEAAFVTGAHLVADGGLRAHSGMPPIGGLGPDF